LIPFPQVERQLDNCQGETIVIKNPFLVKKSSSLLDIGFSYRGEDGELSFELGYEGIKLEKAAEEKEVSEVEKAFLAIGVVTVILVVSFFFISPLTKTRNSKRENIRPRKIIL